MLIETSMTAQLMGPLGGTLGLAFGAGCIAGYGFAIQTAYRAVKARLDKVEGDAREDQYRCDFKIAGLEARQRELEDMLLGRRPLGMFTPVPTYEAFVADRDEQLGKTS